METINPSERVYTATSGGIIMTLTEKEFRFLQRNLITFMHACEYAVEDSRFAEDYEWNCKELELCKKLINKVETEVQVNGYEED